MKIICVIDAAFGYSIKFWKLRETRTVPKVYEEKLSARMFFDADHLVYALQSQEYYHAKHSIRSPVAAEQE